MVEKTEVIQIKQRGFTETFYLRSDKSDLVGFQTNWRAYIQSFLIKKT